MFYFWFIWETFGKWQCIYCKKSPPKYRFVQFLYCVYPGLPPVPDSPGLSRFGAHRPGRRRDPHRDIERPVLWIPSKNGLNLSTFAKHLILKSFWKYFFSIYSSNAYIERVFSIMKNICSDDRSKLLTPNLKAELCVKINYNFKCPQFYYYIKNNDKLLNACKSNYKYTFK